MYVRRSAITIISSSLLVLLASLNASTPAQSQSLASIANTPGGAQFQNTNAAAVYDYVDIYNGAEANAYARTDYGYNHASAEVILPSASSYFQASGSSTYQDSFQFFVTNGLGALLTPTSAQYTVVLDGAMSLPAGFVSNTDITIQSANGSDALKGSSTTDVGASLFENSSYDQWELSSSVNGTSYTSQSYALIGATDSISVGLYAGIMAGTTSYPGTAYADFANTAVLADIVVYDQYGNPIPTNDLLITSSSGAVYSFMSTDTPEPSGVALLVSMGITAGFGARRRQRRLTKAGK